MKIIIVVFELRVLEFGFLLFVGVSIERRFIIRCIFFRKRSAMAAMLVGGSRRYLEWQYECIYSGLRAASA